MALLFILAVSSWGSRGPACYGHWVAHSHQSDQCLTLEIVRQERAFGGSSLSHRVFQKGHLSFYSQFICQKEARDSSSPHKAQEVQFYCGPIASLKGGWQYAVQPATPNILNRVRGSLYLILSLEAWRRAPEFLCLCMYDFFIPLPRHTVLLDWRRLDRVGKCFSLNSREREPGHCWHPSLILPDGSFLLQAPAPEL